MVGPPPVTWEVDAERARAFRMAPDIWQLRLPLPWEGIEHVNAYLLEGGDGPVLVDCGSAGHPSHREALASALAQAGHAAEDISALVLTHVHSDHAGLVPWIAEASGCPVLMQPDAGAFYDATREPARIEAARRRRASQEGVPEERLDSFASVSEERDGVLGAVEPDRPLRDGDVIAGGWEVLTTPGHTPSHVCLVEPERRAVILGDLVARVFAPWFDYGYSDDPVAEYLASLDRVEAAGPFDLALPGHGRALEDLGAVIADHRAGVARRLDETLGAVGQGPAGAFELTSRVFGPVGPPGDVWRMTEIACYLRHLRLRGEVERREDERGRFAYVAAGR